MSAFLFGGGHEKALGLGWAGGGKYNREHKDWGKGEANG